MAPQKGSWILMAGWGPAAPRDALPAPCASFLQGASLLAPTTRWAVPGWQPREEPLRGAVRPCGPGGYRAGVFPEERGRIVGGTYWASISPSGKRTPIFMRGATSPSLWSTSPLVVGTPLTPGHMTSFGQSTCSRPVPGITKVTGSPKAPAQYVH